MLVSCRNLCELVNSLQTWEYVIDFRSVVCLAKPKWIHFFKHNLHLETLIWTDISYRSNEEYPPLSDNSAWARAYRSPQSTFQWADQSPSLGQIWNVIHAIYLAYPTSTTWTGSMLSKGMEGYSIAQRLSRATSCEHDCWNGEVSAYCSVSGLSRPWPGPCYRETYLTWLGLQP